MNIPWTEKYKPRSNKEVPQPAAILQIKRHIKDFKKQGKALLLWGPSGSCKTSAVYAIANEGNLEVIDINASDFRNKDQINEKVGNALKQHSLFYGGKLVLVDEIDGLAGKEDMGGVAALTSLISEANFPMILTANDPWDAKLSSLRNKCVLVKFNPLGYISVFNVLKPICENEGLAFELGALQLLAKKSKGDLRAAINDLQALASDGNEINATMVGGLSERNRVESMLNAVSRVLKTTDANQSVKAFDYAEEDLDKCMLWLDENMPREYKNIKDLARAYESLSRADVFMSRIRRQQHWRFLSYANALITAGVSVAKDKSYSGFTRLSPPTRILKLWQAKNKYQKRKSIAEKLAKRTHCSSKKALQSLAYLKNVIANERIAKELKLEGEELNWLKS